MQSSLTSNNNGDPNMAGVVPNGPNGFEDWACENFNLLEFVGEDKSSSGFDFKEEPSDYNLTEEEAKKDLVYSTWQYNELLANDHNYNQMPYPTQKNGFITQPQQQQPNALAQLADQAYQQRTYDQPTGLDQTQRPSTSGAAMSQQIKQEDEFPAYDTIPLFETSDIHRDHRAESMTSGTSTNASYQDMGLHYEPTIKPRKYRLKPDQEKANPLYRMKREKNNDAVRRSRDKAKRLQAEKDSRLAFLESEDLKNKRLIMQLEQRNQMLENQVIRIKQVCRCGALTGRLP